MFPSSNPINDLANSHLWNRIQEFEFDGTGTVVKFADKLATQNNWTVEFANRVIGEYRKFIFMCCISSTGAAPSQVVDEAWHLHLTYTQSYWINLCKKTLDRDLHHYPSKGGEDEKRKHQKWYIETLELYKNVFGQTPPLDIWPQPKHESLKIGEPAIFSSFIKKLSVALLLCVPFVFTKLNYDIVFPLNLKGSEFLEFYLVLSIAAAVSFIIVFKPAADRVRKAIRNSFPENVNAFHMAEFKYGKEWILRTAIVDLMRRELLKVEENKKIRFSNVNLLPDDPNPLKTFLNNENEGKEMDYKEIKSTWDKSTMYTPSPLNKMYEVAADEITQRYFFSKIFLPTAVLVIGMIRIIQGLINDKPIFFLALEMVSFFLVMLIINYNCSVHTALEEEVSTLYMEKLQLSEKREDEVVTNFAVTGYTAISGFTQGALLASVFLMGATSADGGGSGDGGDGGGGGGCGSGCGGGCGGCGGGG